MPLIFCISSTGDLINELVVCVSQFKFFLIIFICICVQGVTETPHKVLHMINFVFVAIGYHSLHQNAW